MGCVLSLGRSEYSVVWLATEPSVYATVPPEDDLRNDAVPRNGAPPGRDPRAMSRFLVAFCIGVTATLTWQSCSDAARQLVVGVPVPVAQTTPEMVTLASFTTTSLDARHLAPVQQNADWLAASQRQIHPTAVDLPSAQEQIAGDFGSLQRTELHAASKISVPLPRPAPVETRKHTLRPATITAAAGPNPHHGVTSFTSVRSLSRSPASSMRLDTGHKPTRSSAAAVRNSTPEPLSQSLISAGQSLMSALSRFIQL